MTTAEQDEKLKKAFEDFRMVVSDEEGWEFLIERRDVVVHWKNYPGDAISTFRGVGVVAKGTSDVIKILTDPVRRKEWDLFYEDGKIHKQLTETTGIVHCSTKSQYTVWPRDFVIYVGAEGQKAHAEDGTELKEQRIEFVGASIEVEEIPVVSSHVRANVLRGGFLLEPIVEEGMPDGVDSYTRITYIFQVDAAGWLPHSLMNQVNTYQPLAIVGIRKALTGSTIHPPPN